MIILAILASLNLDYYSDSSKINENEDEYDAEGDGGGGEVASARATLLGPTSSTPINTDANIPESFIVELQATARENQINNVIKSTVNNNYNTISTTPSIYDFQASKIVVRPEEALIVILVLILWIGAISLFIHRWGKIRMLEPYTPKFEAEIHRPSCGPLTTLEAVATKRMSLGHMSIQCGPASWNLPRQSISGGRGYAPPFSRPRLNSVFVGPHLLSPPQPPRKTKSAFDIHSLTEAECEV